MANGYQLSMKEGDHAIPTGAKIPHEYSNGMAHPLTDPFNTQPYLHPTNATDGNCYSMDDMAMALGRISNWITNGDRHQRRGVYNRAVTMGFLINGHSLGIKNQTELSKRLKLSRTQTNDLVRDFTNCFNYDTPHQRVKR